MALQRIPCKDLLTVTVRQPLLEQLPPVGHCYISFRAGLLTKQDGKMRADKRKGQVGIIMNADGCVALQWYERLPAEADAFTLADEPEVDQIIFEFEGQFEWLNRQKRLLGHEVQRGARASMLLLLLLAVRTCTWRYRSQQPRDRAENGHGRSWASPPPPPPHPPPPTFGSHPHQCPCTHPAAAACRALCRRRTARFTFGCKSPRPGGMMTSACVPTKRSTDRPGRRLPCRWLRRHRRRRRRRRPAASDAGAPAAPLPLNPAGQLFDLNELVACAPPPLSHEVALT